MSKGSAQTTSAPSVPDKSNSLKLILSIQYNKGMCTRFSEHEFENMLLKYMCQYCFIQNNGKAHTKKKIAGGPQR